MNHQSQLEYHTEMLGEDAGTEFYFYTLEAAPFDQIYRMTAIELVDFGVVTADADVALSPSIVGDPAGYFELAEGAYLKLVVGSCSVEADTIVAELVNDDFGPMALNVDGSDGTLSIPALEGLAPADHIVTDVQVADGTVTGVVALDLEAVVDDLDTSAAPFELPCP